MLVGPSSSYDADTQTDTVLLIAWSGPDHPYPAISISKLTTTMVSQRPQHANSSLRARGKGQYSPIISTERGSNTVGTAQS